MSPFLKPCEPPYSPAVSDDLAGLMPNGEPPIALFRVLAHNPRVLSRFRAGRLLDRGGLPASGTGTADPARQSIVRL